jgi:serine/threonine protein kinase
MLVTTGGHERFLREARVVAALDHPGIVAVHNLGADAQGPYIDMAFLQGADLGRWVKQHGALAPQELLRVAREICRALAYAHGRDVIHRDRTTAPARVERLAKPPHRPNLDSGGPLDRSLSRGEHSYGGRRRAHPADVIRLEFLSPLKMGIKHQKKRIEELRKENERAWTRVSKLEYHVCRLILDLNQGRI